MIVKLDEKQLAQIIELIKWLGGTLESFVTQVTRLNENLEKRG